jgi:hypothetical protein
MKFPHAILMVIVLKKFPHPSDSVRQTLALIPMIRREPMGQMHSTIRCNRRFMKCEDRFDGSEHGATRESNRSKHRHRNWIFLSKWVSTFLPLESETSANVCRMEIFSRKLIAVCANWWIPSFNSFIWIIRDSYSTVQRMPELARNRTIDIMNRLVWVWAGRIST